MDRFVNPIFNVTDKRCRRNGFTIMEVMVALAILSIALTGIFRLHGQTMMVSSTARFYNIAPTLAQAKLSEIERKDYNTIGNATGDFGDNYPGYQWSIQIEDVQTDLATEDYYHLAQINIDISRNEKNIYQLRTYRFFVD